MMDDSNVDGKPEELEKGGVGGGEEGHCGQGPREEGTRLIGYVD